MNCLSITPNINGNVFYLLFIISYHDNITVFTLEQDHLADLLSDFLPYRVQIVVESKPEVVMYDKRIHTDEGRELCRIFYEELRKLDTSDKSKVPKPFFAKVGD